MTAQSLIVILRLLRANLNLFTIVRTKLEVRYTLYRIANVTRVNLQFVMSDASLHDESLSAVLVTSLNNLRILKITERPDSLPRLWRYINLLVTYLLLYNFCMHFRLLFSFAFLNFLYAFFCIFYLVVLRRSSYCYGNSSVRLSVRLSVCL